MAESTFLLARWYCTLRMNSAILPLPVALAIVIKRSITKVNTVSSAPIRIGTMIPPRYIRGKLPLGPSCVGQKPPLGSGLVKLESAPMINLQIRYPAMIHTVGATHEIELPFLFGCTDVELLAAVAAVG